MEANSNKSILIISFYYPPNPVIGARRISKITKELYKKGWNIYVISANYYGKGDRSKIEIPIKFIHYIDWFDIHSKIDKNSLLLPRKIISGFKFISEPFGERLPEIRKHFFQKPAVKLGIEICKKNNISLIYSSFSPAISVKVAYLIQKKTKIKWINEYRDLWTNNPYSDRNKLFKLYEKNIENKLIKGTTAIVTVSPPLKEELIKLHSKPTFVIYNGFDTKDTYKKSICENFNILYTGSVYGGRRDPLELFKALKNLRDNKYIFFERIKVSFYGNNMSKILSKMVSKYDLVDTVFLYESINHKEVIELQRKSDLLLLLGWNNIKEKGIVTAKFFEYIGRLKNILAITYPMSTIGSILNQTGLGVVETSDTRIVKFLKKKVDDKFLNKTDSFIEKIDLDEINIYSRKHQVSKLEKIFNNCILEN